MRILLVEDNAPLADLVRTHLSKFCVVDFVSDCVQAQYFLDTKTYDLLILDLFLPDGKGHELCNYLQQNQIVLPILFLSADLNLEEKISCLRNGDDFLAKPFNISELELRVKNILHQKQKENSLKLKANNLVLNLSTHQVYLNDREIKLNRKEFLLMELLLSYQKQVFSKAVLAEKIWQDDEVLSGNSIETTITNLRRKLGRKFIKTIKGVGYAIC